MSKKHNTHILAVSTHAALNATEVANGADFTPINGDELTKLPFDANDIWVGPRDVLEIDEDFKQIIPYVLVKQGDKYLAYRRTKSGGESKLHDNISIGFGGHIDIGDVATVGAQTIDLDRTVAYAVVRELIEELDGIHILGKTTLGLLLDESNAVGRVHLGVVMVAHVTGEPKAAEDQIELVGWKTLEELKTMMTDGNDLENWSRIVINHLIINNKEMQPA